MKDLFIVDIHSFVDVITNSSSELFICDSKKSLDCVEDMLKKLIELYNEFNEYNECLKYKEVFGTLYIVDKNNVDSLIKDLDGYVTKKYLRKENLLGKVVIRSIEDNSIPWSIMEWIENTIECERIHLG